MTIAPADTYLLEYVLRGGTAALCLLFAGRLVRPPYRLGPETLGALFCIGTAGYALVSSPAATHFPDEIRHLLSGIATMNSVLFWWFATALFDDQFEWNAWRLIPFAMMAGLFTLRTFTAGLLETEIDDMLQMVVIIGLMGHVLWLALAHRHDDLVETRRRFRLVIAILLGSLGVIVSVADLILWGAPAPQWLTTLHAIAIFSFAMIFNQWILSPIDIFPNTKEEPGGPSIAETPKTLDEAALQRLLSSMENGTYRREGLTIAGLAEHIAYPEYKLRRLINGHLGFRNFSAFLNSYRVKEAKRLLADPQMGRVQITQIALDLGYGSIAPFNRAFKVAEGVTPTAFRKEAIISSTMAEADPISK